MKRMRTNTMKRLMNISLFEMAIVISMFMTHALSYSRTVVREAQPGTRLVGGRPLRVTGPVVHRSCGGADC